MDETHGALHERKQSWGYSRGEREKKFPAPPYKESQGLGVFHQQAFEFFPCNKNMTSPLPTPCLCLSVSVCLSHGQADRRAFQLLGRAGD